MCNFFVCKMSNLQYTAREENYPHPTKRYLVWGDYFRRFAF